jgi:hypothetical protein
MASGRNAFAILALLLQIAVATGCRAQPVARPATVAAFAPGETRTLRALGAVGDGRSDDSAALARALKSANLYCLDGEGATYRVSGTLQVSTSLCLRNATLVQSLTPVDTARFITRPCPVTENASALNDCGDPAIPPPQLDRLTRALSVRTLLIRPPVGGAPIKVLLDHVKIDRGRDTAGGSRTDAAGIWLEGAERVDFRDVEITGNGKGYGLLLMRSRNVTLTNLFIHDMVWSPYPGDAPLTQARVAAIGWNSVPIHEFRARGQDGAKAAKFYGVRVQEQITCAFLADVQHVRIVNARVTRCMARFDSGDLPWQADGLDIGQSSSDVVIDGATIDSTWEGIDVVGTGSGVDRLAINNLTVTNSFTFGLKLGYRLRNARVTRLKVAGAGLAGVVVYGPVNKALISAASISGVGAVHGSNSRTFSPWPAGARAGIRIDEGSGGTESAGQKPNDIQIEDTNVANAGVSRGYEYGLLNKGGTNVRTLRFTATDFGNVAIRTER